MWILLTSRTHFFWQVIFGSQGALAGLLGSVDVALDVHGLPFRNGPGSDGTMELSGLPFQGSVRVGKRSLLAENLHTDELRRLIQRIH